MTLKKRITHIAAVALIASTAVGSSLIITADAAYAERGGNGNGNGGGNGRGNGNGRSAERDSERGNNGRGALRSELKGLNAANANQRALENASPNSMPGKLYAYQTAQRAVSEAETAEDAAQTEYDRLVGLTEEEIAEQFPDGGYEDAVTAAATALEEAQAATVAAEGEAEGSLMVLTDGAALSDAALNELHRMLGL